MKFKDYLLETADDLYNAFKDANKYSNVIYEPATHRESYGYKDASKFDKKIGTTIFDKYKKQAENAYPKISITFEGTSEEVVFRIKDKNKNGVSIYRDINSPECLISGGWNQEYGKIDIIKQKSKFWKLLDKALKDKYPNVF